MSPITITTPKRTFEGVRLEAGHYPYMGGIGWRATLSTGELWGQPTVSLIEQGDHPGPGHVFLKVTPEWAGWLESLIAAGVVEDTGERFAAGFVDVYAARCRILLPELDAPQ